MADPARSNDDMIENILRVVLVERLFCEHKKERRREQIVLGRS